eukprot:148666_1
MSQILPILVWMLFVYFTPVFCGHYPYIFSDTLNSSVNWQSNEDIIKISSNCPSVDTICVYNFGENGQEWIPNGAKYVWQSYSASRRTNVYYCSQCDNGVKYLYGIILNEYYYWLIGQNDNSPSTYNRCILGKNLGTDYVFNFDRCLMPGSWQYYNTQWYGYTSASLSDCTSGKSAASNIVDPNKICISGNNQLRLNGEYEFSFYETGQRTNVYRCELCESLATGNPATVFLYGMMLTGNNAYWFIGTSPYSSTSLFSYCYLGTIADTSSYYFNIDDCSDGKVTWASYDSTYGWINDNDMISNKCAPETLQTCAELKSNYEIYNTYSINQPYQNFAVGFDMNIMSLELGKDSFVLEYSCNNISSTAYRNLVSFNYELQSASSISNIIYKLPDHCNNSSSVSLRFRIQNVVNSSKTVVYIDNIILYYNVVGLLFRDNMNSQQGWITNSLSNITLYDSGAFCESDSKCFNLIATSQNYIHITKNVKVNNNTYHCKDFNLQWSLKTTGLTSTTIFDVEIQCINNYFQFNDICIVKEYDINDDCIDNSCNIQKYNLPKECDLSSNIVIGFYLLSPSATDKVYIDYVQLTHSEISGQNTSFCTTRSPSYSPTEQPSTNPTEITINPTNIPTSAPTQKPSKSPLNVGLTDDPTTEPTNQPTNMPTFEPTVEPTIEPTTYPTLEPTINPSTNPTQTPTKSTSHPTKTPTVFPTQHPSSSPSSFTNNPTAFPTPSPTVSIPDVRFKKLLSNITISQTVQCGDFITDDTTEQNPIKFYQLNVNNNPNYGRSVFIDTCGSHFDTELIVWNYDNSKDYYHNDNANCDRPGYPGWATAQLSIDSLFNGIYIIAVTSSPHGSWFLGEFPDPNHYVADGYFIMNITCTQLDVTLNPSVSPTNAPTNLLYYPYLYVDRFNDLSDWEQEGNVSISSMDCPMNVNVPEISTTKNNKTCIVGSPEAIWDGQYTWKRFDSDANSSFYASDRGNKYIYEYKTELGYYNYYINDYETDSIMKSRCIQPVKNIRECIGQWEHYVDGMWNVDTDMISLTCNDACVYGSDSSFVPEQARFRWSHYDSTRRTNVYLCDRCIDTNMEDGDGIFLSGWANIHVTSPQLDLENVYVWTISSGAWQISYSFCYVGANLGTEYIFDLSSCLSQEIWQTYNLTKETMGDDFNMRLEECSIMTSNVLETDYESEICVDNSSSSHLNGKYKWQHYNEMLNESIYYNPQNYMYLYPYITKTGNFQYHIHGNEANGKSSATCNVTNKNLGIRNCVGRWKVYNDSHQLLDTDMIATPCQDICINGTKFMYSHFDLTRKSNIYSDENTSYLYGWKEDWGGTAGVQFYWKIGDDYNHFFPSSECRLGNNFGNSYIFNINDCFQHEWVSYSGGRNMYLIAYKCNANTNATCIKLETGSEISRTYTLVDDYQNFAVGFDINMPNNFVDKLVMEYSCNNELQIIFDTLTEFDTEFSIGGTSITDVLYSLPKSCNHMPYISIKFKISSSKRNMLQFDNDINISTFIQIDNVYLYYAVDNRLLTDPMDGLIRWSQISETVTPNYASNTYCEVDGICYKMSLTSDVFKFVRIAKTVRTNAAFYHKDFNLNWSLQTSALSTDGVFKVEIQCDNNYVHVDDLCIIKQYDNNTDCTNSVCAIQSYNLPSE